MDSTRHSSRRATTTNYAHVECQCPSISWLERGSMKTALTNVAAVAALILIARVERKTDSARAT